MTILDEIVANKRIEVDERKQHISLVENRARAEAVPPALDFAGALVRENIALIAEIKRASPSRGELNAQVDPPQLGQTYAAYGASAISVLTDIKYFNGSLDDLAAVRAVVCVPILCKDFIVDEYQIFESRAHQADAILLIVRVLSDVQLRDYVVLAQSLGMDALVEIHDECELNRALAANARIIGINNRNLADFTVDLATTERIAPQIPAGKVIVAESAVFTRADVERAAHVGAHAVLVGEALMRARDVRAKVEELVGVKRSRMPPVGKA
jgi:indole-3-glycerol phosphate synthase